MRARSLLWAVLLTSGCSGTLLLDMQAPPRLTCGEGCPAPMVCVEGYCETTLPCSLGTAAEEAAGTPHYCPEGLTCSAGLCRSPGAPSYCDCDELDACVDGECVLAADNPCSADNLTGLCPAQHICRDGQCVRPPDEDACSTTNTQGFCPPGFTCDGGYCTPVVLTPCGPTNAQGSCEWGEVCTEPGPACTPIVVACSPSAPQGECPEGEICTRGECQCVPCNPGNVHGCCPDGERCSGAGVCVPQGTCAHKDDCRVGEQCSCQSHAPAACSDDPSCGLCLSYQKCRCDEDCGRGRHCDLVLGECVENLVCTEDGDCLDGECCSGTERCMECGTCDVDEDCRGAGAFCCAQNRCVGEGECCTQQDCPPLSTCLDGYCLAAGECRRDSDCPPGHLCRNDACTPDAARTCTAARVTGTDRQHCAAADQGQPSCCPVGETCCSALERCSPASPFDPAAAVCIDVGRCLTNADCASAAYACNEATWRCEAVNPCPEPCPAGSYCSGSGACVPDGTCAAHNPDCAYGEFCNESFHCERATACGEVQFDAKRVKPNVLIVLDRSGSMELCQGDELQDGGGCCGNADDEVECALCDAGGGACTSCVAGSAPACGLPTRWTQAVAAVDAVTSAYSDVIRFGLSTYPDQWCGASACGLTCNYCSCDLQYCTDGAGTCVANAAAAAECHPNYEAGQVSVPVADDAHEGIMTRLGATYPGGGTPTGPTLRRVSRDPRAAGVAAADRDNYVILVTDGAANGDVDQIAGCRNTNYACKVDKALDGLRALTPAISTYVVGFAFGGTVSPSLNCHADHGAQATCPLPFTCAQVKDAARCTSKGCVWSGTACAAPACSSHTGVGPCQAAGCSWSGGTCTGDPSCKSATATCYYEANDAAGLVSELGTIIGEVSSCAYALDVPPQDETLLFAYFLHDWIEERVTRDRNHIDGWDYRANIGPFGQVEFYGPACDRIKNGEVMPLIVYGCQIAG